MWGWLERSRAETEDQSGRSCRRNTLTVWMLVAWMLVVVSARRSKSGWWREGGRESGRVGARNPVGFIIPAAATGGAGGAGGAGLIWPKPTHLNHVIHLAMVVPKHYIIRCSHAGIFVFWPNSLGRPTARASNVGMSVELLCSAAPAIHSQGSSLARIASQHNAFILART